jgi:hypothetical protein
MTVEDSPLLKLSVPSTPLFVSRRKKRLVSLQVDSWPADESAFGLFPFLSYKFFTSTGTSIRSSLKS